MFVLFQTEKKGYGVRTRDDIAQSSVVGEYVGEIIDQRELAQRLKSVPRVRVVLLAPVLVAWRGFV
jgi:SET domain-containing protein